MNTRKKVAFQQAKLGSPARPAETETSSDDESAEPKETTDKEKSPTHQLRRSNTMTSEESKQSATSVACTSDNKKEVVVVDTTGDAKAVTATATAASIAAAKLEDEEEASAKMQKAKRYQYGNYNRYYGFESLNKNMDVRLKIFQRHVHLFKNKDVLDVGCNCGLMTLAISKYFAPKSITGVDIDPKLIKIARSHSKRQVGVPNSKKNEIEPESAKHRRTECFPMSFPICYGNIGALFKQVQSRKIQTPQNFISTPQTPQNEAQDDRVMENVFFEEVSYFATAFLLFVCLSYLTN